MKYRMPCMQLFSPLWPLTFSASLTSRDRGIVTVVRPTLLSLFSIPKPASLLFILESCRSKIVIILAKPQSFVESHGTHVISDENTDVHVMSAQLFLIQQFGQLKHRLFLATLKHRTRDIHTLVAVLGIFVFNEKNLRVFVDDKSNSRQISPICKIACYMWPKTLCDDSILF